ncbi:hypothetical protein OVA14_05770 [Agrococcus sp. SL85]|uniref:prealbumin-like fold domain-containing protein n=1 Tax=Agrococcus sp. SL85 TaxID=2995141 RepID=UPI00226CA69B|nr:hypothetical protein [Agrococcus sp. SL85]WAC67245.1 hypothetical protein OVA14_05770 [Agrococcus sp. SL85]
MSRIERAASRSRIVAIAAAMLVVLVTLVAPVQAPAAQAVTGPEPTVSGPYLSWRVADSTTDALVGGASFEVQRSQRSRNNVRQNFSSWSAFSTIATIADCTAAGCAATGDRDPDAGEFQLTNGVIDSTNLLQYRYQVREVIDPAGYGFDSSAFVATASPWGNGAQSLGTFTVTQRAAVSCTAGTIYSVLATGVVRQIVFGSGTPAVTTFGGWNVNSTQVNSLGIGRDGTSMYALIRGTLGSAINADVTSILRYTVAAGWEVLPDTAYATGNSANLIAGAVSLTTGEYFFGGPHLSGGAWSFRLHKFDPATGASSFVGSIATGQSVLSNGDMAFDAAGNLMLIQSNAAGTTRFMVAADDLAAGTGGTLPADTAPAGSIGTAINGIAYDGDATIFAGDGTTVRRYDTTTWTQIGSPATGVNTSVTAQSTDLAGCIAPVTITVQKQVVGRVAATDQFALSVREGSAGDVLATATTSGTATGLQAQRITAVTVPTSASYTIAETMASGTAANYASSWACTSDGAPFGSGTGTTIGLTTPAAPGANVVCTFTNAPLVTTISIRKDMQDVDGRNAAPRQGWTVGAAIVSGATQIGPVTTSNQSTAANGTASWTLRHASGATNAQVTISEARQAGFAFVSASCTVRTAAGATSTVALPGEAGATLTLSPGSAVSCVFTNKVKATTLTLVKQVTFGTAPANLFTLTATAPAGALAGPTGASGAAATTGARITPAVAYRLSESGGPATYAQVGSWTCVNQDNATVPVSTAGDVTAAQGDSVTCTVRNATASLVILERIEGSTQLTAGQFSLTSTPAAGVAGLQPTTVTGSEAVAPANTIQVRPGHGYSLESTSTAAFIGLRFERYVGPAVPSGAVDHTNPSYWVAADPASVSVAAATTSIYRFVATSPTPFSLPLTGGIGADQIQLVGGGLAALAVLAGLALLLHRRRRTA